MKVLRGMVAAALAVGAVSALPGDRAAADPGDIGFQGQSYTGSSGSHPSQEKPESKLWYHDGSWWGSLWSNPADSFNVHRLDPITHTWVDTGTVLETAPGYRQDTLWDGSKLYVASHQFSESPGSANARVVRLSYNAGSWSVDAGFPATISNAESETLTIEKDTTGRLWATWTTDAQVWVNHTTCSPGCNDAQWGTPFLFGTVAGIGSTASTDSDDISGIVAFAGRIGIFWSNQRTDASYFAIHDDDDPPTAAWTLETPLSGSDVSDDHINLATDGSRVFATVKTSFDSSNQPETYVLRRDADGTWSSEVSSFGSDGLTRPIITYDQVNDELHWFATDVAGGHAYTKSTSAANLALPTGSGTPVLFDASANDMNNVSSTKQAVDPSTGLVVLGTDNVSQTYWHHEDTLGGTGQLAAGFVADDTFGEAPHAVQFTDTSVGGPTEWAWTFGDGGTATTQSPSHVYSSPGLYTVSLTVTNADGSDSQTRTDFVEVVAPLPLEALFAVDPPSGGAPLAVQFTDQSTGTPVEWLWDFGDGTTSTDQHPAHVYNSVGTFDVTLTVHDAGGGVETTTVDGAVNVTDEVVLTPVADALLRIDRPTSNYGDEDYLRIRDAASGYRSLVQFDATGIGSAPVTAVLRMYVTDASPSAGDLYEVDDAWTELGVTDGNAPPRGPVPDVVGGEALIDTWYEWDVTALIDGPDVYSFLLESTSGNSTLFSSREGANPPELVITTAASASLGAAFEATPTAVEVGESVAFSDLSTGAPISWSWEFGDGGTSSDQHPTHVYTTEGTYDVTLEVGDGTDTATTTLVDYVTVSPPLPLDAAFDVAPSSGAAPLSVTFTDTSTGAPSTFAWEFGDGGTSSEQHPTHVYTAPGTYDVTLTVGDGTGTDVEVVVGAVTVDAISVIESSADSFVRSDRTTSNYGTEDHLRVRQASGVYRSLLRFDVPSVPSAISSAVVRLFVTDASPSAGDLYTATGPWTETAVTWDNQPAIGATPTAAGGPAVDGTWHEWDVTDAFVGASAGAFDFTLVTGSGNSAFYSSREGANPPQLVITGVSAPPPLTAEFSATPLSGVAPSGVQFTDMSTGPAATSWVWDFGDGGSSTEQDPFHVYASEGLYTVTLTVGDGTGATDDEVKVGYVEVLPPPPLTAEFSATPLSGAAPLEVAFTDMSTGPAATSWVWDFGDGSPVSNLQDPVHSYASEGVYTVTLTVGDGSTTDVETKVDHVSVSATPSGPTTFEPAADAYYKNDRPDNNYGTDTWLRLRQSSSVYESVLRFEVDGLTAPASNATLRLFVTDDSTSAGEVHLVDAAAWTETGVTYNNRPPSLGLVAADRPTGAVGTWVEWDVTAAVTGSGVVSLKLISTSSNSVFFSSREGANPPQLVVTP